MPSLADSTVLSTEAPLTFSISMAYAHPVTGAIVKYAIHCNVGEALWVGQGMTLQRLVNVIAFNGLRHPDANLKQGESYQVFSLRQGRSDYLAADLPKPVIQAVFAILTAGKPKPF